MMDRRPFRSLAACLLLPALLMGCAAATAPVAPGGTVHLALAASPSLNPGRDGVANPVQLRIYSLKAKDRFLNTDYFQLAEKDKSVLGDDLLFRQDVTLRPGEKRTIDSVVLPGQQVLGLTVGYREIDRSTWRLVAPLIAQQTVTLDANAIVQPK